nr:MAG TPA: hypothetical protein [Caudoviricetes sp.]
MATFTSVEFYLDLGLFEALEIARIVNKKSAQA